LFFPPSFGLPPLPSLTFLFFPSCPELLRHRRQIADEIAQAVLDALALAVVLMMCGGESSRRL
jgi:hypothetical protein